MAGIALVALAITAAHNAFLPAVDTTTRLPFTQRADLNSLLLFMEPVPDLEFLDGEGRELTLDSFKGQTLLLNIWATWCVPCREEMPALDRLQAKLGGPEFRVVALSIDRGGLPMVKDFYEELGLQALGIYVDPSGNAASKVRSVGIPITLLVDRNGREVARAVGPAEWDSSEVVQFMGNTSMPKPMLRKLTWAQTGSVAGSSLTGEQIARVWDLSDGCGGEGDHAD